MGGHIFLKAQRTSNKMEYNFEGMFSGTVFSKLSEESSDEIFELSIRR